MGNLCMKYSLRPEYSLEMEYFWRLLSVKTVDSSLIKVFNDMSNQKEMKLIEIEYRLDCVQ